MATCRKAGILINTFMLASDHYLVDFVKKVTEICRGQSVLHDDRESRPIHSDGLPEEEGGDDSLSDSANRIKKPRRLRGFLGSLATYFFFFVAFFFAGAFFFAAIINSPPILILFTTIAHLFRVSLLFKNIFKTCHIKIQSKNHKRPFFIRHDRYHRTFF